MKVPRKNKGFLESWHHMSTFSRTSGLYTLGFILSSVSVLLLLFQPTFGIYLFFLFAGSLCIGLAFTIEAVGYIRSIWKSELAKFLVTLLGLISVLCWWTAKTLSFQVINWFIPVNPSNFPLASQSLSFIIVIFLWLILALVFFLATSIVFAIKLAVETNKPSLKSPVYVSKPANKDSDISGPFGNPKSVQLQGRVFGSFLIAWLILSIFLVAVGYSDLGVIQNLTSSVIAWTDHYSYSVCSNYDVQKGERVAFLEEKKISVAIPNTKGGYTFEIRECVP